MVEISILHENGLIKCIAFSGNLVYKDPTGKIHQVDYREGSVTVLFKEQDYWEIEIERGGLCIYLDMNDEGFKYLQMDKRHLLDSQNIQPKMLANYWNVKNNISINEVTYMPKAVHSTGRHLKVIDKNEKVSNVRRNGFALTFISLASATIGILMVFISGTSNTE